jgi:hypothetical protein
MEIPQPANPVIRGRMRAVFSPDQNVKEANKAITDSIMAALKGGSHVQSNIVGSCPKIAHMVCIWKGTLFFPDRITIVNFLFENGEFRGQHSWWEITFSGGDAAPGPRCNQILTSTNQQGITLAILGVINPWLAVAGAVVAATVNVACG